MAHTTILPSVVGNKDLRLLQALITDEKAVRNAHERLGQDTNRAASALSAWGDEVRRVLAVALALYLFASLPLASVDLR